MKALTAIVKLTLRNAIRSHVFQLLLGFLILCVALIPTTVAGSTAMDFIRVSLLYSLSSVGTLLSLSTLWVGCQVMSSDIDSYQLHMVVAKPVSRVTVWAGKFLGVLILHLVLLVFAAAAIYGVVLWRFNHGNFSPEERDRIRREVLVGRRVFLPERPDYGELAKKALEEKIRKRLASSNPNDRNISPKAQDQLFKECLKEVAAKNSEVNPSDYVLIQSPNGISILPQNDSRKKEWIYKGVPRNAARSLYLRYRPYVTKVKSEDQRQTVVRWFVYAPRQAAPNGDPAAAEAAVGNEQSFPHFLPPNQVMSGEFHEAKLPGDRGIVSPKGEVRIGVYNFDKFYTDKQNVLRKLKGQYPWSPATQFYQPADGPKLLVEITGFFGNYCRAVIMIVLQLTMMAMLSCALGGFLTLPTAVFVSTSYLMFGFMATFITDPEYYVKSFMDKMAQGLSQFILNAVVPLERFDVTELVAGGELVEWGLIWNIMWSCLLLRMLPLALAGIYFYRRREIGLVIRK